MTVTLPSLTPTWHKTTYPSISPTQQHLSVQGKSILITGGGRGIGAQTARSFARAGASFISITGRTLSALQSTKSSIEADFPNTTVLVRAGDVSDEAVMDAAFSDLSQANGGNGVDICIHNAAYLVNLNTIAESNTADWWSGFTTNVLGSFVVTRAFLKHRNTSVTADPVIVGISTGALATAAAPKYSGYGTSKAAQFKFFDALAVEEQGVRVMQVHPGVVYTDMGKKSSEGASLDLPVDDISLPADFIVWAVSPDAAWLQGRLIWSNWDVDELKEKKDRILSEENYLKLGMVGWPFQA